MEENVKELLKEGSLEKASGGNSNSESKRYLDECFDAILSRDAIKAWFVYHDHYNEINEDDKDFLQFQYREEFHLEIDDVVPPSGDEF